jgi:hypothetical protein
LILLSLVGTSAEGNAAVWSGCPCVLQPPGAECRARHHGPDTPQRFATRDRAGKQLGQFIETLHA